MKTKLFSLMIILLIFACSFAYAGKIVATHVLSNTNGFFPTWAWAPNFACDEKGNIIQFFTEVDTSNVITKFTYVATTKKNKVYSTGPLPELVGNKIEWILYPTGISLGNGAFSKTLLLIGIKGPGVQKYFLYKLGKSGATKVEEVDYGTSDWSLAYMYKNKIVIESGIGNNPIALTIDFYNKKLKKLIGKGGTINADQGFLLGKSVAFVTFNDSNTVANVTIAR